MFNDIQKWLWSLNFQKNFFIIFAKIISDIKKRDSCWDEKIKYNWCELKKIGNNLNSFIIIIIRYFQIFCSCYFFK